MTVVDRLVTVYEMNSRGYVSGANAVTAATNQFAKAFQRGQQKGGLFGATAAVFNEELDIFDRLGPMVGGIVSLATSGLRIIYDLLKKVAGAAGAATVAFAGFAIEALETYARIDALKRGLATMVGSADAAEAEFKKLREVARLPGLGLEEAVRGATRLMAAGLAADEARAALEAFGNAIAVAGGGKDDLQGVILALSQIASKGKVFAEEINQLAERIPQIRVAMKDAFGTSDTQQIQKMGISAEEFIARMTAALAKIPKMTGGAKNTLENFQDSVKIAMATAGKSIDKYFTPAIDKLSLFLEGLESSGIVKELTDQFSKLFGGGKDDMFVTVVATVLGVLQELPTMIRIVEASIILFINAVVGKMNEMIDLYNRLPFHDQVGHVSTINSLGDMASGSAFGDIPGAIARNRDEIIRRAKEANEKDKDAKGASSTAKNMAEAASETARNTKAILELQRKQFDLQRALLGGGNIAGQFGPADIAGIKGRVRGRASHLTETLLETMIREVHEVLGRQMRARA